MAPLNFGDGGPDSPKGVLPAEKRVCGKSREGGNGKEKSQTGIGPPWSAARLENWVRQAACWTSSRAGREKWICGLFFAVRRRQRKKIVALSKKRTPRVDDYTVSRRLVLTVGEFWDGGCGVAHVFPTPKLDARGEGNHSRN